MVFSSIYTLVLTLTCSPPCPRCSVQPIAVAAHSLRCHASPLLVYALFCFAYALHNYAFAILFYAKLCRCVPLQFSAILRHRPSSPFHATAIQRYSMPMRFASSLCLCVCFAFLFSSLFALPLHLLSSCCFAMPMLFNA